MKTIALLIAIPVMFLTTTYAQQVNTENQTKIADSVKIYTDLKDTSQVSPIIAPDFPAKPTVTYSDAKKEGPKDKPTNEPTNAPVVYGEKFCDVSIENDTIFVKNYNGRYVQLKTETEIDMKTVSGITFVKEKNMIFIVYGGNNCDVYQIQTQNGKMSLERSAWFENSSGLKALEEVTQLKDGTTIIFKTDKSIEVFNFIRSPPDYLVYTYDGSEFFKHQGAMYEDVTKGIFVATTPTTLFVKTNNGSFTWTIKDIVGTDVPPLEKPIIDLEDGYIRIRDPTMRGNGKSFMILYDPVEHQIGLFEDNSFIGKR